MNKHKLTEHCIDCIIHNCRFKDSPDRFEANCGADPTAYVYSAGPRQHYYRQKQRDNHQERRKNGSR